MAEKSTFVKIDRNILNWRWIRSPNTLAVWLWLILKANIKPHDFENETIERGQVATSRKTIAAGLGLTERQVRTALEHLKASGEVSVKTRSKYQVISILRYDEYQTDKSGNTSGKSPAEVRQKSGRCPQSKNDKEGPTDQERRRIYIPPSVADVEAFAAAEGLALDARAFVDYNTARGWKGVTDWRPLVRLRAQQLASAAQAAEDDGLDDFGRPRKEYE